MSKLEHTDTAIADKLADIQLYLFHLTNTLNIKLSEAVTRKDKFK